MKIEYSKRWFRSKSSPIEPLTEDEARKYHLERSPYVAFCDDPKAFIEISNNYIGIGFLDSHGREYLSCQFQEKKHRKLFLTMAIHRNFLNRSQIVKNGTAYFFDEHGKVIIEDSNFQTKEKINRAQEVDVSGNWEDYPEFGSFQKLLKIER